MWIITQQFNINVQSQDNEVGHHKFYNQQAGLELLKQLDCRNGATALLMKGLLLVPCGRYFIKLRS